jgi:predicted glycosyltransferase
LGTPVFTVFEGRLGAVDERLIADGRLARLERPDQVTLAKRADADPTAGLRAERVRRDPELLVELLSRPANPA